MAIFSNDPNQGIRDAGMEQFIPTPVSSITYKGNAGVNARRAGSYTNTPRIVSGRKKPAPTDPSQMTPEQKSSFMAKSGDSTTGKPSQRFAPYDRIRIGPGSTSTSPNESGIVPAGKKAFVPSRVLFPHEAHQPNGTRRGRRTLAQQVDGILPPVVAAPNITLPTTISGKAPPGLSAILSAGTASTLPLRTDSAGKPIGVQGTGQLLSAGKTQMSPAQAKFAEIRARYDRENKEARDRMPVAPTFSGPTEAEIQAGRNAAQERIAGYAGLAKDWTDASPEERNEITKGLTFDQMADLTAAIKNEGTRRYGQDVDEAHAQRDAADAEIRATQEDRSQRDREFKQQMIERDAEIARLAGRARAAYRNSEQNTRDRQFESNKRFMEAMAESPLSKVFSRNNPFGSAVYETGKFVSERPGMQDLIRIFGGSPLAEEVSSERIEPNRRTLAPEEEPVRMPVSQQIQPIMRSYSRFSDSPEYADRAAYTFRQGEVPDPNRGSGFGVKNLYGSPSFEPGVLDIINILRGKAGYGSKAVAAESVLGRKIKDI